MIVEHSEDQEPTSVRVGDPTIDERITQMPPPPTHSPVLIRPDATVGHGVDAGPGCVAPGAGLSGDITLGEHIQAEQNVTVGHDATVGGYTRLHLMGCISGAVQLGRSVYIGYNATALQGLRVGDRTIVGAGAVVVQDVPKNVTVKGVLTR